MAKMNSFFTNMCDELVEIAETDRELKAGLKWIDCEAQKRGITFYEMVFEVLYLYDLDQKAKEWMKTRN
ncbi:MAG: hypothetical protein KGI05_09420 [Thaumarchaeota archaeon]|nr:hypothetical protein [Nitrososphaerota archaeon]